MRPSSTLPPLPALRAFEAAGRLLSFRRAGEELLITQSAVSHQIRQLEDCLGARLFVRKARSVALTDDGRVYLSVAQDVFARLAAATARLRQKNGRRRVRASLLPSFAANWLISRLAGFEAIHPDIAIDLDPTLRLADMDSGDTDVAIRFGDGTGDDGGQILLEDELTPVVSPRVFEDGAAFATLRSLESHPLLLTHRAVEWQIWADAAQIDWRGARQIQLTDYNIVLQAALDGQGVAMGRGLLVRRYLETGLLVRPFDLSVRSPKAAWRLLVAKTARHLPQVQAFCLWIAAELGAGDALPPGRRR